jgi:hypothetical protein
VVTKAPREPLSAVTGKSADEAMLIGPPDVGGPVASPKRVITMDPAETKDSAVKIMLEDETKRTSVRLR